MDDPQPVTTTRPRVGRLLGSRGAAGLVLVLAAAGAVLAVVPGAPAPAPPVSSTGLGTAAESTEVERLREGLPGADTSQALVVVDRRDGEPLTPADLEAVAATAEQLQDLAVGGQVPPPQPAPDGTVALVAVPAPAPPPVGTEDETATAFVDALRAQVARDLPADLRGQVTGPSAFAADLGRVFDGADVRLLIATAIVVGVLLLVTYRSPLLVLVPLVVVAATEQVTLALVDQVLPRLDLPVGGATTGIASVLVFGAATDYALLLIARYREQLRREQDPFLAMRAALSRTAEAILASGGSVVLALTALLLASTESLRAIAVACIIGVLLAMAAALLVLPAALVVFGRAAFWPFVPRVGDAPSEGKLWGRLGAVVARSPARTLALTLALLTVLASGALGLRSGLSEREVFVDPPEAVTAAERLAEALPAGATDPAVVVTRPEDVAAVVSAAQDVDGVASARPGPAAEGIAEVTVVLEEEAGSAGARDAVLALRAALDRVADGSAVVGGAPAERVDAQDADARDARVVIPLVLVLVLLVLVVLLRSLLAPVLLVATVVLTFASALGASWLLFDRVLDLPALDGQVLLLSFLFLVALGVDYNIFLATRAREEARTRGTRDGMLTALRATGGVITSAGVLLASVFAVLGVLPVIALTQIGTIVCIGVLLDTLVVRPVVVPALAFLLGDRFWWPSAPAAAGPEPRAREHHVAWTG